MEIPVTYLVVFDFADLKKAKGQALAQDLDRYSTKRPMLLFASSSRAGYLIRTSLPRRDMTFDGNLLNGDSVLILELTGHCSVEGYTLKDAAEWIRRG